MYFRAASIWQTDIQWYRGTPSRETPPGMTLFGWVRLSPILTEIDTKTLHKCVVYDQSIMSSTAESWHYVGPSQFLNVRLENGCYWIDCCCFKSNLNKKKDKNILQDNQSIFLWISNYRSLWSSEIWVSPTNALSVSVIIYLVDTWCIIHNGPFFALMMMVMKFVSTCFFF